MSMAVCVWKCFIMWFSECRIWCRFVYIVNKLIAKMELLVYTFITAEATIVVIKLIINRLSLVEQSITRRSHSMPFSLHTFLSRTPFTIWRRLNTSHSIVLNKIYSQPKIIYKSHSCLVPCVICVVRWVLGAAINNIVSLS